MKEKEDLRHCGDPEWAMKESEGRSRKQQRNEELSKEGGRDQIRERPKRYSVVPYVRG